MGCSSSKECHSRPLLTAPGGGLLPRNRCHGSAFVMPGALARSLLKTRS